MRLQQSLQPSLTGSAQLFLVGPQHPGITLFPSNAAANLATSISIAATNTPHVVSVAATVAAAATITHRVPINAIRATTRVPNLAPFTRH
jgi:hypothetical protein